LFEVVVGGEMKAAEKSTVGEEGESICVCTVTTLRVDDFPFEIGTSELDVERYTHFTAIRNRHRHNQRGYSNTRRSFSQS
jgi:hypothetical protein